MACTHWQTATYVAENVREQPGIQVQQRLFGGSEKSAMPGQFYPARLDQTRRAEFLLKPTIGAFRNRLNNSGLVALPAVRKSYLGWLVDSTLTCINVRVIVCECIHGR